VPSSFSAWIQRAGRSPKIEAHAILLVKKLVFQWWKKRWKKKMEDEDDDKLAESSCDDSKEEVGGDSKTMEWGKKVDPDLQWWIETKGCC